MCGIAGEIRFDGQMADPAAVERMAEVLAPRGPDGAGRIGYGPVAFAHRRLKIIDISVRAQQPMLDNELGLLLVFNGAIYNYPELRQELQGLGYRFSLPVIPRSFSRRITPGALPACSGCRACSHSPSGSGTAARCFWPVTAWASSRCITRSSRTAFVCLHAAGLAGRGRSVDRHRSGGTASLHEFSRRGAGAAHHRAGRAQAAAGHHAAH